METTIYLGFAGTNQGNDEHVEDGPKHPRKAESPNMGA